ncbi:MAG: GNAT family N-acetyltransferase [Rhodospirillum sp.]|nr:GNAT family N-acetyltransferase [Rhodospirillum sp.]
MPKADTKVEVATAFTRGDLSDLCQAADDAIKAGGGFGWLTPPRRDVMETYWKGVLMVPERTLIVGRLDNVIVGSAQLVRPTKNNEAQAHSGQLTTSFMAPWARGHGLARMITEAVENHARKIGLTVLNLDVRETQEAAITLYRSLGYTEIGRHEHYARVDGKFVAGLYFWKDLTA